MYAACLEGAADQGPVGFHEAQRTVHRRVAIEVADDVDLLDDALDNATAVPGSDQELLDSGAHDATFDCEVRAPAIPLGVDPTAGVYWHTLVMTEVSGGPARHGAPSYIELCVEDADKARAFYGALLGWSMQGAGGPGQASTGGLDVGIHDRDPSSLLEVFFTVVDLDAAIGKLAELGGRTVGEVHAENAQFGRWVECQDDQGVRFGLRQPPG